MSKPAEGAPAKKSKKMLFIIVGVAVLLAGGGAGAFFVFQGKGSHDKAEAAPPKAPIFLPLETFTINLADGEHYLQTDITLQFSEQAEVDGVKLHMPRVRSRLLTLLSGKTAESLTTPEDKKKLAQEVLEQVKQPFYAQGKPQKVDDVLFTSFVIQ